MRELINRESMAGIEEILDVSEESSPELKEKLENIAGEHNAVLLAMIAPYVGVKATPSKVLTAHLGISEEFGVETVIEEIQNKTECKKLYLLINSPGGLVQSSYKVARAIRNSFEEIVVFVPHIAASGGTLVALAGNEIVMGLMSQLTPLDPQKDIGNKFISAQSIVRGFDFVTEFFRKVSPEDAPYTFRVLAEKFDAVDVDEALSIMNMMKRYITEILEKSGYSTNKCESISEGLVTGFYDHGEVITYEKAKKLGLNVVEPSKYPDVWPVFREWLGKYLLRSADKHIIRYIIPKPQSEGGKNDGDEKCDK